MANVLNILGLNRKSMKSAENRLKTLIYWPVEFMNNEEIAESGFYYDGLSKKNDTVRCFSCDLTLSDWKPGNVPNERHYNKCTNLCEHLREISKDPVHPEFESLSSRQESFVDWKHNDKIPPEPLYKAGFFYVGVRDLCYCHHCGKSFPKITENMNPLKIHKKISENCRFLKSILVPPAEDDLIMFDDSSESSDDDDDLEGLSDLNIDDSKCCVCFKYPKDVVLKPCGHTFCSKCSPKLKFCPTCRKDVVSTLNIHI